MSARDDSHRLSELVERLRVPPGAKVDLERDHDPDFTAGWLHKRDGRAHLKLAAQLLAAYQDRLAAQDSAGLLVVLQGIDAAGKDSTIRHVMSGVNPKGVVVRSFKEPSEEELNHDFLWRYQRALPGRGQIAIYDRSHYEEVLVVRVHPELLTRQRLPPGDEVWQRRYRDINAWERHVAENGFTIVKLLLNISREEQRARFLRRIDREDKNWKLSAADVRERNHWDEYQHAYSQMLSHTSTAWAPWHVIPANHKWFARIVVAATLVDALARMDPQYPAPTEDEARELRQAREELTAQAPKGEPADPFLAGRPRD